MKISGVKLIYFIILITACLFLIQCSGSGKKKGGIGDPCVLITDCQDGLYCSADGKCYDPNANDGGNDDTNNEDVINEQCADNDHDGYYGRTAQCPEGTDCDDNNNTTNPGAQEICGDDIDNNCNDEADEPPCLCKRGRVRACFTGAVENRGKGICQDGYQICGDNGEYGECMQQRLPEEEVCDGEDNDCDGDVDEELLNVCGECGDDPQEICGDNIDNNCNNSIDEGCECDPGCHCDDPEGVGDNCECHPPTNQPCYSGNPSTMGKGICIGGLHDCVDVGDGIYQWSSCRDEVLPQEECVGGVADEIDNDCDSMIDEGCLPDRDGDSYSVEDGDCDDSNNEIYPDATEVCDGIDNDCDRVADDGVTNACGGCGEVEEEQCGDGLDNDCDGDVDEGCSCTEGQSQDCYTGPPETLGKGKCKVGTQTCEGNEEFRHWGDCINPIVPQLEVCDGEDNDCDNEIDERWAFGSNLCGFCSSEELCDGEDNDCDGQIDEEMKNSCGQCLPVPEETLCDDEDNDCDGLTDEDLLNSCGLCPPEPCYTETWDDAEGWDEGDYDGTGRQVEDPLPTYEECRDNPDVVCLDTRSLQAGFAWIANDNESSSVSKIDLETGQEVGRYKVGLEGYDCTAWSGGCNHPSRTAVDGMGNAYVTVRGFGGWGTVAKMAGDLAECVERNGIPGIQTSTNQTPLSRDTGDPNTISSDECVLWQVKIGSAVNAVPRAIAIDKGDTEHPDGYPWVGCYYEQRFYKLNPDTGEVLDSVDVGVYPYGAAIDSEGNIWISGRGSNAIRAFGTSPSNYKVTTNVVTFPTGYSQGYGIAVDQRDRVWLAFYDTNGIAGYNPETNTWIVVNNIHTRGVAIDSQGKVWASNDSGNCVYSFSADDAFNNNGAVTVTTYSLPSGASGPIGVGIDYHGRIWTANQSSSNVTMIDPVNNTSQNFPTDHTLYLPYTYSDFTGFQRYLATNPSGIWRVYYDSGYDNSQWSTIVWTGTEEPPTTNIEVRARTAATRNDFIENWTNWYDTSPADISSAVPRGRWLEVEVRLSTTNNQNTPILRSLNASWSY